MAKRQTPRSRNAHADDPHDRAWALAEVWGDLTHTQTRALYGALSSNDRDAFNIIANQHKRAGLKGLTGHAIEAFQILRADIVDDGRERNPDDDAEQDAIDERERNAGTGHRRHPGTTTPISDRSRAGSPSQSELIVEWADNAGEYSAAAFNLADLSEELQRRGYRGAMLQATDEGGNVVGWVNANNWQRRT